MQIAPARGKLGILLVGLLKAAETLTDTSMGVPVFCQTRTTGAAKGDTKLKPTQKNRVASRGDETAGIELEQIEAAQAAYRSKPKNKPNEKGVYNYPDNIYRPFRKRPLLMIHPLAVFAPLKPNEQDPRHLVYDEPIYAWGISFPSSSTVEEKVQYVVTRQWMRENMAADLDDSDMEADGD